MGGLLLNASSWASDVRDIELRRVFEPTRAELPAEADGRIYIYEGLRDIDVEQAMEEGYERIESMMFIREEKTGENGELPARLLARYFCGIRWKRVAARIQPPAKRCPGTSFATWSGCAMESPS